MNKSLSRVISLAVAALLTAACAGPRTPLEVSVKEFPTDVLLGKKAAPPPPPLPGANLNPGFPTLFQPPSFTVDTRTGEITRPPPAPVLQCPTAHPFTGPTHPAFSRPSTAPPAPGEYVFRNTGTISKLGAKVAGGAVPAQTRRQIDDIRPAPGGRGYDFTVYEDLGPFTRTMSTYRVIGENSVNNPAVNDGTAGVFLVQYATESQAATDNFNPNPAIKLLEFPAEPRREWDTRGVDPLTQASMTFHARIGIDVPDGDDPDDLPDFQAKTRVDACGVVLDAWIVDIVNGQIVSGQGELVINARYAMAPQFGGLTLMETVKLTGTSSAGPVNSENTATISSEPKLPG